MVCHLSPARCPPYFLIFTVAQNPVGAFAPTVNVNCPETSNSLDARANPSGLPANLPACVTGLDQVGFVMGTCSSSPMYVTLLSGNSSSLDLTYCCRQSWLLPTGTSGSILVMEMRTT
ncbi:hypothetical protein BDR05DRAFT_301321 [Suillus weaverae]|nr:hypothetical protein BDR05DRAFT_301321 [Suillus weaverae]